MRDSIRHTTMSKERVPCKVCHIVCQKTLQRSLLAGSKGLISRIPGGDVSSGN